MKVTIKEYCEKTSHRRYLIFHLTVVTFIKSVKIYFLHLYATSPLASPSFSDSNLQFTLESLEPEPAFSYKVQHMAHYLGL